MDHKKVTGTLGSDVVIDLNKAYWVKQVPGFDLGKYIGYPAHLLRRLIFADGTAIAPSQVPDHWVLQRTANSCFSTSFYFYESPAEASVEAWMDAEERQSPGFKTDVEADYSNWKIGLNKKEGM